MTKTLNFTKKTLTTLSQQVGSKRTYFKDSQLKGLFVCVQPSGTVSFFLIKKINGKAEKIRLGKYPDLSVENARKEASKALGKIAQGINPQEEKRSLKAEMTLGQLFDDYMRRYSKIHKKTWRADAEDIPRFFGHWFKRKMSDIKRSEIQCIVETVYAENGLYQANKALQRIRAVFNKGIDWGWNGRNPTTGIKKYREKSRERFIQPAEMPWLLKALAEIPDETISDYFRMLLLTGARKTNTITMKWADIQWERMEWRIPTTKNGDAVNIPLLDEAMEVLRRRKEQSNSEWVFPRDATPEKPLVSYRPAWKSLLQKASIYVWAAEQHICTDTDSISSLNYEAIDQLYNALIAKAAMEKRVLPVALMDIHIHDLRRTFGSYQALTGASLQVIGKSLGHKSTQATQIYSRLNLDPVRLSMEKAATAMFKSPSTMAA